MDLILLIIGLAELGILISIVVGTGKGGNYTKEEEAAKVMQIISEYPGIEYLRTFDMVPKWTGNKVHMHGMAGRQDFGPNGQFITTFGEHDDYKDLDVAINRVFADTLFG